MKRALLTLVVYILWASYPDGSHKPIGTSESLSACNSAALNHNLKYSAKVDFFMLCLPSNLDPRRG